VSFDPFLYAALAGGFVLGRFVRLPAGWVRRASIATVLVLVALLGGSIAPLPTSEVTRAIPVALGFTALILLITVGMALLLGRRTRTPGKPPSASDVRSSVRVSAVILAALLLGYALGRATTLAFAPGIPWALYVLLALVGLDLTFSRAALRHAWLPITAAAVGAVAAAVVFAVFSGISPKVSFAIALGFGWYSLTGPLVAARAGAYLGVLAFLTNFFRENLTMVLAPVAGPRLRGEGLAAAGGATSMDTTLFFITRYGDPEAGGLALTTGLVLTLAAGLLLPLVLSL
jgi:uncharacterized membrane protein YbjE (DUF340 family)